MSNLKGFNKKLQNMGSLGFRKMLVLHQKQWATGWGDDQFAWFGAPYFTEINV